MVDQIFTEPSATDFANDLLSPQTASRLVTATIRDASADVAVCELTDGSVLTMPVTEFYPNRIWQVGQSYHLVLSGSGPTAQLSAIRDELVGMLLSGLSPEVRDGRVRVINTVRVVGVRSKVAVAATIPDIDAVGACLGRAATRIKTLSAMLLGERVDVVAYHTDPDRFLLNALAIVPLSVATDDAGLVTVTVPAHQLTAARGGGSLNVVLASRLCGVRVQVVPG